MEMRVGGLDLREREEFILIIPPDFPFEYPSLIVTHHRFASFPHVIWSTTLCLYQSTIEWNPADGLYGFFDRLRLWLGKAAINDMDPVDGPLEPPHHVTDFSQRPFVVRANAPAQPGERWFGLAELEAYPNRVELVGWNDLTREWLSGRQPALAIVLPEPLPMEFPKKGREFFRELSKQGIDRDRVLRYLALASFFSGEGEPIHLVLGLPMRRSPDGSPRLHIAVWTTDGAIAGALRAALPEDSDPATLRSLRQDIADRLLSIFEETQITWCRVLEDRSEAVVRRDAGRPMAWFTGKRVLILGCGALGSWAAEMIARANPTLVHLLDNSIVKPGLLARQNYRLEDIASRKAEALANRLRAIVPSVSIDHFNREAHTFLTEDVGRLSGYDLIVDCTASAILQMKLERDWRIFGRQTPAAMSMVIDAKAQRCLAVIVNAHSEGGLWDAYVQLRYRLSRDGSHGDMVAAFYTDRAASELFQPEPGCSDPTFSGSTADVSGLVSTALNIAVTQIRTTGSPIGIAFSSHHPEGRPGACDVLRLSALDEIVIDQYRVRIREGVYGEARAWARQNNRVRSRQHETGGLLWGLWDETIGVVWVFDASGPPPDSSHDPGHFICGIEGTVAEHKRRLEQSRGTEGFIGFWHTHPDMPSEQSLRDIEGMTGLVARIGQNQRNALMLIFGRAGVRPTAGVYVYESRSLAHPIEMISVGVGQITLGRRVV